ncbi:IS110 family transposase, partial [Lactobacillus amylovorus]|uniref:IS110 family transposase n=1 Tax=Lactobacillus amylovorus TaxID=1604 RepID=UPI001F561F6A
MENCKVIVGIDVSSKDSTVCVLMDKVRQGKTFKISNDMVGFQQLYKRLYSVIPLIVFESTGVYSLSLQAFLEKKHIQYL